MKKWTEEEFNKAKRLLENGKNFGEISKELGRSWSSVKNKLNKSGLTFEMFNPAREKRKCLNCDDEFDVIKSDPKKFCGNSCSASHNNKLREKKKYGDCLSCGNSLNRKDRTYCSSSCQHEFRRKQKFELIESGDISLSSRWYKKYLIHIHGEKCMECGWCEVNQYSGKIPIELEHIDGNSENNDLSNLKLLCPNHHSLTPTYKALNTGNGRYSRRKRYKEGKSY